MTTTTTRPAPVADWVTINDLYADPYPIFRRMREEAPVHWVPAVNRYMVVSYDACHTIEQDPDRFTAREQGSLMYKAMGHSMLRKDDPEHAVERAAYGGVLKPRAIKESWTSVFEANTEKYIAHLKEVGSGADLIRHFAAPFAAANLVEILGTLGADWHDMERWSQHMIDGTGNYADDPEVWARALTARDEVETMIDELAPHYRANPDHTLLSHLVNSGIPMEAVKANMCMSIGGGVNEPRDAVGTTIWALLLDDAQREAVLGDPPRWADAFEESVRWVAPIGMYPRQVTGDTVLEGIELPAGARVGVCLGAANRDPQVWEDPESFDLTRSKKPHLAFGGGQHFCAGTWVARASVAQVALPRLFAEFPNLRLDPDHAATVGGWVFRGMLTLPVQWA